jgi:hypothetical protein
MTTDACVSAYGASPCTPSPAAHCSIAMLCLHAGEVATGVTGRLQTSVRRLALIAIASASRTDDLSNSSSRGEQALRLTCMSYRCQSFESLSPTGWGVALGGLRIPGIVTEWLVVISEAITSNIASATSISPFSLCRQPIVGPVCSESHSH